MIYTQELAKRICAEVSDVKPLRTICKMEGMPSKATICRWYHEREDFRLAYDVARGNYLKNFHARLSAKYSAMSARFQHEAEMKQLREDILRRVQQQKRDQSIPV